MPMRWGDIDRLGRIVDHGYDWMTQGDFQFLIHMIWHLDEEATDLQAEYESAHDECHRLEKRVEELEEQVEELHQEASELETQVRELN